APELIHDRSEHQRRWRVRLLLTQVEARSSYSAAGQANRVAKLVAAQPEFATPERRMSAVANIRLAVLIATLVLITAHPGRAEEAGGRGDLKPGEILSQSNWKKAEALLPPEVLKHYQNGEYANPIIDWPAEQWEWPPDFLAGTEKNAGQFDVDDSGTIIEKG